MASFVTAILDQCLVVGFVIMTYVQQMVVAGVEAISAISISAHQDNRARSSQVLKDSLLQITRCLDSASDNYQAGEINSYSKNTRYFI